MQLTCPQCGEHVPAEKINIQQLIAVCPHCDTVFEFSAPKENPKRRKVKQPQNLMIRESDRLEVAFRTNFTLDQNENFIVISILIVVFTITGLLGINSYPAGSVPLLLSIAVASFLSFLFYSLGLIVYNKTHIVMDDEAITVSRKPLPNIFRQAEEINLSDVIAIHCEETAISKKEAYDTQRYAVFAETSDGRRKIIVNDVTEDYAYFIARRLDEYLHHDEEVDTSRLVDHQASKDADFSDYEIIEVSKNSKH